MRCLNIMEIQLYFEEQTPRTTINPDMQTWIRRGSIALIEKDYIKEKSTVVQVRDRHELRAQRLINLEIPALVRSVKSSNVGLG